MQEKLKRSVWDYLFYASMSILTIWLILKVTGVINTPFWLEYGVLIGTFILGFFTFYQSMIDKIIVLSTNDARIEAHLIHLDKNVEFLKTNFQKYG